MSVPSERRTPSSRSRRLREPFGLGAFRVDLELVQRFYELDVPLVATHRGEDDAAPVRGPRWLVVLAVTVGELALVAAVEPHDEEVPAAVADPADAVELVEDSLNRRGARRLSSSSSYASSRTRRAKAIRRESGDHAIDSTPSLPSVSRRSSPPSTGRTYSSPCAFSSSPSRLETNASQCPSGDQRGEWSLRSPEVNCLGSSVPSSGAHPDGAVVGVRLAVDPVDDVGDTPAVRRQAGSPTLVSA
jgi:hypothetical protein